MRPNISCLDFLVLQSSPKVLCIWWSSFRDLENIVKVQDLWCMTTTFIWIIWWEINASSKGWLMIVEPTWGLVLPCPLFDLFLLTPLQALYWVLYIYIYIYIYIYFLIRNKEICINRSKDQEKDERSFPQNTETDQRRMHPSIENYIQR